MKILASILIVLFGYSLVLACSCSKPTETDKEEILEETLVVFSGKVISTNLTSDKQGAEVKFQILRGWKGIETNEIVIRTASESAACGYTFRTNETYLVYGFGNPHFTTTCYMMLVDETKVRKKFGEGKNFQELPTFKVEEGFFSSIWRKIVSFFS